MANGQEARQWRQSEGVSRKSKALSYHDITFYP